MGNQQSEYQALASRPPSSTKTAISPAQESLANISLEKCIEENARLKKIFSESPLTPTAICIEAYFVYVTSVAKAGVSGSSCTLTYDSQFEVAKKFFAQNIHELFKEASTNYAWRLELNATARIIEWISTHVNIFCKAFEQKYGMEVHPNVTEKAICLTVMWRPRFKY